MWYTALYTWSFGIKGLERWMAQWLEHLLLFKRTPVQFSASAWGKSWPPSSKGSSILWFPQAGACAHTPPLPHAPPSHTHIRAYHTVMMSLKQCRKQFDNAFLFFWFILCYGTLPWWVSRLCQHVALAGHVKSMKWLLHTGPVLSTVYTQGVGSLDLFVTGWVPAPLTGLSISVSFP